MKLYESVFWVTLLTNKHHYVKFAIPVAVASRLTFDLGVVACGSTSPSGSLGLSVSVVCSCCTGEEAGAG